MVILVCFKEMETITSHICIEQTWSKTLTLPLNLLVRYLKKKKTSKDLCCNAVWTAWIIDRKDKQVGDVKYKKKCLLSCLWIPHDLISYVFSCREILTQRRHVKILAITPHFSEFNVNSVYCDLVPQLPSKKRNPIKGEKHDAMLADFTGLFHSKASHDKREFAKMAVWRKHVWNRYAD